MTTPATPWYERAWFIKALCYGFVLLVAVKFVHSVFFKQNDFDWHVAYGALAIKATYFADNEALRALQVHYPPGRILIDEGLSLLPRLLARAIFHRGDRQPATHVQHLARDRAEDEAGHRERRMRRGGLGVPAARQLDHPRLRRMRLADHAAVLFVACRARCIAARRCKAAPGWRWRSRSK